MRIALPGLFDLQVNGFGGIDFNAPDLTRDRAAEALDRMLETGVTRCLPTLITSSFDRFAASARVLADLPHSAIAGIHMEGPYLSRDEGARGAHSRADIVPASVDDFRPTPGRRRRLHPPRHARAGSAGRAAPHRASRRDGRARRHRAYGRVAGSDWRGDCAPAPRWRRIWGTGVRRCCRAIPT